MNNNEYILAFDGRGYVELFKVNDFILEDFFLELESDGKLYTVVTNEITNDELILNAKEYK